MTKLLYFYLLQTFFLDFPTVKSLHQNYRTKYNTRFQFEVLFTLCVHFMPACLKLGHNIIRIPISGIFEWNNEISLIKVEKKPLLHTILNYIQLELD